MAEDFATFSAQLAYRGSAFSGFARQPDQLTVQGDLEKALEIVLRHPVETTCAGRTDTGVHARGQVVSFDLDADEAAALSLARFQRSLNAVTHEDITVSNVQLREPGFSARFDAKAREYRYFICNEIVPPLFARDFCWHIPQPLDVGAMERASRCLIGEHDFKSFCRASSAEGKPTCRNLMEIVFGSEMLLGEELLAIRVVGSSFLHSMVRTLVGSLVMVGRRERPEEWLSDVLATCDRAAAGETAPAQGLILWNVQY